MEQRRVGGCPRCRYRAPLLFLLLETPSSSILFDVHDEGFRYNPLIESFQKKGRKKEGRKERKKNRADSMLSFDRCNCFVAARKRRSGFFLPFFLRFPSFSPSLPNYFPTKTVYNAPPVAKRKNPAKAYRKRKLFL